MKKKDTKKKITKRDRELLLKDLCARLPYKVMLNIKGQDGPKLLDFDEELWSVTIDRDSDYLSYNDRGKGEEEGICEIRPYMRSIKSMTEEEKEEFESVSHDWFYVDEEEETIYPMGQMSDSGEFEDGILCGIDWLNSHHIDYRGMIDLGLAIEAPDGMYNVE